MCSNCSSTNSCDCHLVQLNSQESVLQDFVTKNQITEDMVELVEEKYYNDESIQFKVTWGLLRIRILHNKVYIDKLPLTPPTDAGYTYPRTDANTITASIQNNDMSKMTSEELSNELIFLDSNTLLNVDLINKSQLIPSYQFNNSNSPLITANTSNNLNLSSASKDSTTTPKRKTKPKYKRNGTPKKFVPRKNKKNAPCTL